jgi:hypothetical protein
MDAPVRVTNPGTTLASGAVARQYPYTTGLPAAAERWSGCSVAVPGTDRTQASPPSCRNECVVWAPCIVQPIALPRNYSVGGLFISYCHPLLIDSRANQYFRFGTCVAEFPHFLQSAATLIRQLTSWLA